MPSATVITWVNIYPDLCHDMVSLGHHELTLEGFNKGLHLVDEIFTWHPISGVSLHWPILAKFNDIFGPNESITPLKSSPPSDAYMWQWIGSALVQIMACRLLVTKPLSKSMLCYCQLDHQEQSSVKFESQWRTFHSRKCIRKYRLRNGGHFVQVEMS